MTTFYPEKIDSATYKLGSAKATEGKLTAKLGEGIGPSDNSDNSWFGVMTANDGTQVEVACWDWRGDMREFGWVNVWASKSQYVHEWIQFLEA